MCYRLVERYSVCRCLYHKHSVDTCAAANQAGHTVQERTVLVGYLCTQHSSRRDSERPERAVPRRQQTNSKPARLTQLLGRAGRRQDHQSSPGNTIVESRNQVRPDAPRIEIRGSYSQSGTVVDTILGKNAEVEKVNQPVSSGATKVFELGELCDSESISDFESDGGSGTDPDDVAQGGTWSEREASSGSATTAPDIDIASAELVSLLVGHDSLKNIYPAAITAHGQHEFRLSMYIVLRSYGKALKAEAKHPQELQSGDLVCGLARRVAHAVVAFHDPSNPSIDVDSRWEALRRQKTSAVSRVEDYLSRVNGQRDELERAWDVLSDASDIEGMDEPLRNLDKVKAYMTSGPAFEQLCKDVLRLSVQDPKYEGPRFVKLKKAEAPEKQVFEPSKYGDTEPKENSPVLSICEALATPYAIPHSSLVAILRGYQAHKSRLKAKYWPKLNPQCTRLHWKCDCGVMLYEDYATTDPATIIKLSLLINNPSSMTTESGTTHESPLILPSKARDVSIETRATGVSNSESSSNEDTQVCQGCSSMRRRLSCTKGLSKKFLALCVNTGRFHATLGEIDLTNICRDSETFRTIKDRYLEVRGFRARARRLFLFQPHSVHFVKVNVEDTYRADIVEKPFIPPREEVLAKRYEYSPLDLPLPPITSNSFLHYLENPECESLARTSRWLSCLPKRLGEQLVSRRRCCEPDVVVTGWGIHIEEGLNEEALACIALIILVCSGLLGLTYSVKMGDVSGGFTVAAYVATVLGVGISVLCFRWRQQ